MLMLASCGEEVPKEDEESANTASSKETTGEFIVIDRTATPDPKTSEYADCLYTAKLQVVAVEGGVDGTEEQPVTTDGKTEEPRIVLAAMPAFLDRKLQAGHELAVGDRFRAKWIAFDEAPERFRKMQTADKFGDYLLEYRLVTDAKLVRRGAPITAAAAAGAQERMPEIPKERFVRAEGTGIYAERRKARMSREQARMQAELEENGGSWEAWMKKLEPYQEDLEKRSKEAGGTLKQDQHVFARLGLQCYFDLTQDDPHVGPLAALRLLNAELQRHGIDLVVVPFPNKEDVNAHKFLVGQHPDAPAELNPCRIRFMMRMLEHGIEVLDLVPALRAGLDAHPFVYYDNRDTHPADGGIQIAAGEVAKVLADYDLLPADHTLLPMEKAEFVIEKDMEYFTKGSRYPAHRVLFTADAMPKREVLLQGDSFLSVPSNYVPNATIADHVGRHLGYRPDKLVREAGANLILQDLARLPKSELQGRKVLFFVFGPTRLRSPHSPLMLPELHWHLALLPE